MKLTKQEQELIIEALRLLEKKVERTRFLNSSDEKLLDKSCKIVEIIRKIGE